MLVWCTIRGGFGFDASLQTAAGVHEPLASSGAIYATGGLGRLQAKSRELQYPVRRLIGGTLPMFFARKYMLARAK